MTTTHPFSHCGPAPYLLVSLETPEDREVEARRRAALGLVYTTNTACGGTCDVCGTAIAYVYTFEAADGRRFRVGCECAQKAGEGAAVRAGRRAHDREIAERRQLAAVAEREALQRERNAADPEIAEALTDREVEHLRRVIAELESEAVRLGSRHVGRVGERVSCVVVYEGSHVFETAYGSKRLLRLRTLSGDSLVWWTTSGVGPRKIGDRLEVAATIKRHTTYRDAAQTEVSRLRVIARMEDAGQ